MRWFWIWLFLIGPYLGALNIAVTLDDFPMPRGALFSMEERIERILNACEAYSCQTAFFCVGDYCTKKNQKYLAWANERGHFLANHSMTHPRLSRLSLSDFKEEILQMEALLSPYSNKKKWFRYPYLDYGHLPSLGGSIEKAFQAMGILKDLHYVEGYVTINTFDFHINLRLKEALKQGKQVDYAALKDLYLSLIEEWSHYYIQLYKTLFKEEMTHTVLLHDNDLNALYLKDILRLFTDLGWTIVSPEEAFKDVSWRKSLPEKFEFIVKPPSMNSQVLDQKIQQAHLFY